MSYSTRRRSTSSVAVSSTAYPASGSPSRGCPTLPGVDDEPAADLAEPLHVRVPENDPVVLAQMPVEVRELLGIDVRVFALGRRV